MARRLRERLAVPEAAATARSRSAWLDQVRVVEATGEGTGLLTLWRGVATVFLVDAVVSGGLPGLIHCIDANVGPLPAIIECRNSHAFGIVGAIELARVLGELPPCLRIYGVEGCKFDLGLGLSPEVALAVEQLSERLLSELGTTL